MVVLPFREPGRARERVGPVLRFDLSHERETHAALLAGEPRAATAPPAVMHLPRAPAFHPRDHFHERLAVDAVERVRLLQRRVPPLAAPQVAERLAVQRHAFASSKPRTMRPGFSLSSAYVRDTTQNTSVAPQPVMTSWLSKSTASSSSAAGGFHQ